MYGLHDIHQLPFEEGGHIPPYPLQVMYSNGFTHHVNSAGNWLPWKGGWMFKQADHYYELFHDAVQLNKTVHEYMALKVHHPFPPSSPWNNGCLYFWSLMMVLLLILRILSFDFCWWHFCCDAINIGVGVGVDVDVVDNVIDVIGLDDFECHPISLMLEMVLKLLIVIENINDVADVIWSIVINVIVVVTFFYSFTQSPPSLPVIFFMIQQTLEWRASLLPDISSWHTFTQRWWGQFHTSCTRWQICTLSQRYQHIG